MFIIWKANIEQSFWKTLRLKLRISQRVSRTQPTPTPVNTFSNQLVSTYKDQFKCVAELNENSLTFKTTPHLKLRVGKELSQVISIKPVLATKYHFYIIMTTSNNSRRICRFWVKSLDVSKDILDEGWEGEPAIKDYLTMYPVTNVKTLLPKLPHWLAYLFGGNMTIEEEHTYNEEGEVKDTTYRVLTVINRQDKNPLVETIDLVQWKDSPTITIEK